MTNQYQTIRSRLDAFPASRDTYALAQLGHDIEVFTGVQTTTLEAKEQRRIKLELWLIALNKIDEMKDPNFDPHDVPQRNVEPPASAALDAGVTPREIKDPKVREQYEQAIAANAKKAERYRLHKKLVDLDRDWSSKLNAFIKDHYTSQAQDVGEANTLIDRLLSSNLRREQVKSILLNRK